jgi:hypothetical protein
MNGGKYTFRQNAPFIIVNYKGETYFKGKGGRYMFENFEVSNLWEGHVHERTQFSLSIGDNQYKGMFHGDKIHWYNPHPTQTLEEEHVSAIESKVFDLMSDHPEQ